MVVVVRLVVVDVDGGGGVAWRSSGFEAVRYHR
jgi:hypothetical protein